MTDPAAPDLAIAELNALADRCEAATGPDRELDIDICTRGLNKSRLDHGFQSAPYFTASIDAAMSLVPEGWQALIASDDHATVCRAGKSFRVENCANPALALCAASLRALAKVRGR